MGVDVILNILIIIPCHHHFKVRGSRHFFQMDFEFGSFKSKRAINLGGNTVNLNKQKLLVGMIESRIQRQQDKLKLSACLRIQAFWRGRTRNAFEKISCRSNYHLIPNANLSLRMTSLSFFYKPSLDANLLWELSLQFPNSAIDKLCLLSISQGYFCFARYLQHRSLNPNEIYRHVSRAISQANDNCDALLILISPVTDYELFIQEILCLNNLESKISLCKVVLDLGYLVSKINLKGQDINSASTLLSNLLSFENLFAISKIPDLVEVLLVLFPLSKYSLDATLTGINIFNHSSLAIFL